MSDDDQTAWGLEMPFVTVTSKGGPHDDDSYTAGWEMGGMDACLAAMPSAAQSAGFQIHAANKPQADLIAMNHGWKVEASDPFEGWLWLDLTRDSTDIE